VIPSWSTRSTPSPPATQSASHLPRIPIVVDEASDGMCHAWASSDTLEGPLQPPKFVTLRQEVICNGCGYSDDFDVLSIDGGPMSDVSLCPMCSEPWNVEAKHAARLARVASSRARAVFIRRRRQRRSDKDVCGLLGPPAPSSARCSSLGRASEGEATPPLAHLTASAANSPSPATPPMNLELT
jgi:hypothetical protein